MRTRPSASTPPAATSTQQRALKSSSTTPRAPPARRPSPASNPTAPSKASPSTAPAATLPRSAGLTNIEVYGLGTIPGLTIESASDVSGAKATLNATVNPDGVEVTECKFEYGTTTAYGSSKPCAGAIPTDSADHAVSAALSGLLANGTTYHYRVVAKNAEASAVSDDKTFTTIGPPQITGQVASSVMQTTATLQAQVNPSGLPTTYHFEWGTDASYGTRIPVDDELFAGAGTEPVKVTANLSGLQPVAGYHFRVLATNSLGTTEGPDQPFETLNAAGLPNNRGFELVSPADKGTSGSVSRSLPAKQVEPGIEGRQRDPLPDPERHPGLDRRRLDALARRPYRRGLAQHAGHPAVADRAAETRRPRLREVPSSVTFTSPDLSCAIV